jgi:hypothetical protein
LSEKFDEDIDAIVEKILFKKREETFENKLRKVARKLKELHRLSLVKINHSVMEVVVASELLGKGFEVDVEHDLGSLVCDVYAEKGDGSLIVEVETGYVPPEHALDPLSYTYVRIISKVARYSKFANKFVIATPIDSYFQIDPLLIKTPNERTEEEILRVKELCDKYYKNPPIELEELKSARLHGVMLINVDDAKVLELDPEQYLELISNLPR